MTDLISKQAAIDAIKRCESANSYDLNNGLILAMNAVADVPTIDPVKHGKWERDSEGEPCCSLCGKYTNDLQDEPFEWNGAVGWALKLPNYCSRCGARMDL